MNKPLSRVRRAEIERDLADQHVSYNDFAGEAIRDLLASESFWREAVKNVTEFGHYTNREYRCSFCSGHFEHGSKSSIHKPDCAWLLANES